MNQGAEQDYEKENDGLVVALPVVEVISVLLAGEARTGFMNTFELAVAYDLCVRIVRLQCPEQGNQSLTLGWSASVGRTTFFI